MARNRPTRMRVPKRLEAAAGDASVSKLGVARIDLRDPYYLAVALSWPQFICVFLGLHLSLDVLFAALYIVEPGSVTNVAPGAFWSAFFFSIETLATVGYGVMAPASTYGHIISACEIIVGMAFTAIMTGLTFVRFSRPKAKIVYAEKAVVTAYNGQPTLMIRIGNGRNNTLVDARVRLTVLMEERTTEGHSYRRVHELSLRQAHLPVFPLTWTLMHTLDQDSPLQKCSQTSLMREDVRMFLSFDGRDPQLSATVHDLHLYNYSDILFGLRYADAIQTDEHGVLVADLGRISLTEPDTIAPDEPVVYAESFAQTG
jgi:inward rectifier potassium channel